MSCLFRILFHKKSLQILLDNTLQKSLYHNYTLLSKLSLVDNSNLHILRFKSQAGKNKVPQNVSESESTEEKDEDFDDIQDKHTKTMKINVPSMRVDTLLRAGLGLSRNKIEVFFYGSNIRVNGEKLLKKSISVKAGDEIDVIMGFSPSNPDFLSVARLEVLSAKGEEESISVKIRRCKSLAIENYEGRNKWTRSSQE